MRSKQERQHFGFSNALISKALMQISNCKCIALRTVDRTSTALSIHIFRLLLFHLQFTRLKHGLRIEPDI
jgi:hypothetical protein